jgi:hypothetical protein
MTKKDSAFEKFMTKVVDFSNESLVERFTVEDLKDVNEELIKEVELLMLEREIMMAYITTQAEMLLSADSLIKQAKTIIEKDKGIRGGTDKKG